jgi:glycosyltransferase involved in cell wall biosynthesis
MRNEMMNNPNLLIVVVLYKCSLKKSSTWESLRASKELIGSESRVLVFDNGPEALDEFEKNLILGFSSGSNYFHYPQNLSLAKIYNLAIQMRTAEDFLLILDQDSQFDSAFFLTFFNASREYPDLDLFLPYVLHESKVVSPGTWLGYKGEYWKGLKTGKINSQNQTAISSGMLIRFQYLNKDFSGFDESFTLYGIDTYFMQQYSRKRGYIFVLDYELKHDLSIYSEVSPETRLFRFRNFFTSTLLLTRDSIFTRTKALIYLFYKSIDQSLKNQDIRYFTTWFNSF